MQDTTTPTPQGAQSARPIDHIRELAVHLRQAQDCIHALSQAIDDALPVEPRYGADSLTGQELREDITAWSYEIKRAQDVLYSNFTPDVVAALKAAGLEDEHDTDDEDDRDEEDEALTVVAAQAAELPSAKTRPYWLS